MKANLLLLILIIGFNSSLVAQTSQVITDSVTINGRVTDYDNHPLDNVSVSWARPDFSEVSVTLTDKNGNYSIRIPKGKYHSMGALNMDEYIIANSTLPEKDQRLEFWGMGFYRRSRHNAQHTISSYGSLWTACFQNPGCNTCLSGVCPSYESDTYAGMDESRKA